MQSGIAAVDHFSGGSSVLNRTRIRDGKMSAVHIKAIAIGANTSKISHSCGLAHLGASETINRTKDPLGGSHVA
jgi:hypothetical protein